MDNEDSAKKHQGLKCKKYGEADVGRGVNPGILSLRERIIELEGSCSSLAKKGRG